MEAGQGRGMGGARAAAAQSGSCVGGGGEAQWEIGMSRGDASSCAGRDIVLAGLANSVVRQGGRVVELGQHNKCGTSRRPYLLSEEGNEGNGHRKTRAEGDPCTQSDREGSLQIQVVSVCGSE